MVADAAGKGTWWIRIREMRRSFEAVEVSYDRTVKWFAGLYRMGLWMSKDACGE